MLQQPQVFRHEENNLAAVAKVESVIARELNSCARMELSVNPKRFAHSKNSRPSECSDGLCYACAFFSLSSFPSPARSSFSRASSFSEQV